MTNVTRGQRNFSTNPVVWIFFPTPIPPLFNPDKLRLEVCRKYASQVDLTQGEHATHHCHQDSCCLPIVPTISTLKAIVFSVRIPSKIVTVLIHKSVSRKRGCPGTARRGWKTQGAPSTRKKDGLLGKAIYSINLVGHMGKH